MRLFQANSGGEPQPGDAAAFPAGCSFASPLVRWRLLGGLVRLPSQVGAGDHAGQDAQPRLNLLPLMGGVLRGCSPWRLSAGGPGFPVAPGGTRLSGCSCLFSHSLSLGDCDWASASSRGSGVKIMSFTLHPFWSSASLPLPRESVSSGTAPGNYLWGLSTLITLTGPSASCPSRAVLGVYRRLSSGRQPPGGSFKAGTGGIRPPTGRIQ